MVKTFCDNGTDDVLKRCRSINSDNARRIVEGHIEARLIEVACSPALEGYSQWASRLLKDEMKVTLDELISRKTIQRT